ncbi:uncharacterized protein C8Q71DRAFT_859509 [Rhodofomes roseus]|uniref:Uncharacterized protein n=1 Tax=Rhodofomes roseus TaxID=34475 RepID=A0A4Y9XWT4_9APHY|nr:uncharacterized protein C8Q71DRAFT_859509 [Rhodofomes roseus]KAH9834519.1 hypothetical protein C8Q71DRAFT_859509 [Rhodofomes roseus]TFY54570.1 hypothetical protein EVJ58_g8781 [Rhodofomes roseus]
MASRSSASASTRSKLAKLNQCVSVLEPPPSVTSDPLHPSVVLLFGWLEAAPSYLQKYVDRLHDQFPTSTIVLVRAYTSWYFTSYPRLEKELSPAVDVVKRESNNGKKFRGVLIHVLSNGGSLQLLVFRQALMKSSGAGDRGAAYSPTPVALILDSTPALRELASAIQSWAPRNPVLRYLAIPGISALYGGFYLANALVGNPPLFPTMRDQLNTLNLLPSITNPNDPKATPRLYIYSNTDRVTPASEVEAHYEAAVAAGLNAKLERFTKSAHVSHSRADPERYWGAVTALWKEALQTCGVDTPTL